MCSRVAHRSRSAGAEELPEDREQELSMLLTIDHYGKSPGRVPGVDRSAERQERRGPGDDRHDVQGVRASQRAFRLARCDHLRRASSC